MKKHLESFSEWIIGHRLVLLVVFALVTVAFATLALRLEVNNDHDTWLPQHDKVAQLLRQADKDFSSNVMLFCVIQFEKGVFTPEALTLMERITHELENIDELFNVTSITNILDIRRIEGGIEVNDLIPEIPETEEGMHELQAYVLSKETYVNSIVSSDCIYTAIMTNIESDQDEVKIADKVFQTIDRLAASHPHYYGGDPAVHYFMNFYMIEDMKLLVPIIIVVVVIVLGFGLRRISGVFLPMSMVGLSIVWTFGIMSILNFPVNILSPAVVVLLVALGSDYAVHIYNHYLKRGDVITSTSEITQPVVMSAMTTIAGLLTFSTTRIEVLNNFGIELAFGLGCTCILSITLMGILLYILKTKPALDEDTGRVDAHIFTRVMFALGGWVHDHARIILVLLAIVVLGVGFNITKIRTNVDFIGQLPEDSPPREGCNILMDHFNGMYPFNFYVRGDLTDPAVMNRMNFLENFLRSEDTIYGFTSINSLIAEENWLLNGVYAIPESRQGIANLWFMLEGHDILKTFVTPEKDKGLVNSIVKESETNKLRYLANRVELFMTEHVSDQIVTLDPGMLSAAGRGALNEIRIREASRQLSWLSAFYDRENARGEVDFSVSLAEGMQSLEQRVDLTPVWRALHQYLSEETVEILPEELIEQVETYLKAHWATRYDAETLRMLTGIIQGEGIMNEDDAVVTTQGLLKRFDDTYRIAKVEALMGSLAGIISPALDDDKNFRKRSRGVVWEFLSEMPVFFRSEVAGIPGIDQSIVSTSDLLIDQAGMPETVRLVQKILIRSQVQSLGLAVLIVLIMVSLAYRSLRRGVTSMMTVLVPLVCILGFMGLNHIPLDLGTVLCGSLIVGLGIDGSIQFLHHYNMLHLQGLRKRLALQTTMGHVGRAVLTANGTTFFGFIVLLLSSTTAVRNFSVVNSVAIFLVTVSVLTLLPALVTVLHLDRVDDLEDSTGDGSVVRIFEESASRQDDDVHTTEKKRAPAQKRADEITP
ncbi:MAG: efflux RND transporter permease subunit [Desulfomonilia bacterium]